MPALAADDADLAQSFLELARERDVPVDAALAEKVEQGERRRRDRPALAGELPRGLVTGEPDDLVGFAGTALGDLFVFGDIRDAVREGTRLASGQEVDELILGLACVGLAVTAGTYATVGAAAPARVGLTVVKAARKTGRIGRRDGGLDQALAARGRRLARARADDPRGQHHPAGGGRPRRARGRQGREGEGASCGSSATSAACRPRPARAPRSTD